MKRTPIPAIISSLAVAWAIAPSLSWACGCGCSTFDVRTSSMLPTREGGTAFLEYNFVDQNRNWSHSSSAPAADNEDKRVKTEFYTIGAQYMFNRRWGVLTEFPFEDRTFRVLGEQEEVEQFDHFGLGDVRIKGIYTGFSPDLSSGLTLGLKLPTGDFKESGFDRDTQIGTGSTDILLGAFTRGQMPGFGSWDWFLSGQLDQPAITQDGFRPGAEVNGVAGIYYRGWQIGGVKIAPVAQAIGSYHWADSGSEAHPADSGYHRLLLAPGVEVVAGSFSLYADVAFPVYEYVNGNQLVAEAFYTLRAAFNF
jgi:hypothetical protein